MRWLLALPQPSACCSVSNKLHSLTLWSWFPPSWSVPPRQTFPLFPLAAGSCLGPAAAAGPQRTLLPQQRWSSSCGPTPHAQSTWYKGLPHCCREESHHSETSVFLQGLDLYIFSWFFSFVTTLSVQKRTFKAFLKQPVYISLGSSLSCPASLNMH